MRLVRSFLYIYRLSACLSNYLACRGKDTGAGMQANRDKGKRELK
jgi:hypothetical protein